MNAGSGKKRRASPLGLTLAGVLFVAAPFLTWEQTWFGRDLSDAQMKRYFDDEHHPRNMQHALARVSESISRGDARVRQWYPRVASLAHHPAVAIRSTAAWTMGQDNTSDMFHGALLGMLADTDLMVRRNAALSLVRFHDPAGRQELLAILRPFDLRAPASGIFSAAAQTGQKVGAGTLLGRVTPGSGHAAEIRAPFGGEVGAVKVRQGTQVKVGAELVSLASGADQVWEALRALYLIGNTDDAQIVERYTHGGSELPDSVRRQAAITSRAIRARAERNPSR